MTLSTSYLTAHFAMAFACYLLWRFTSDEDSRAWKFTLVLGVAIRLLLVVVPPFTSHDSDRYLWDGRIAAAGVNPYRVSPKEFAETHEVGAPLPDNAEYATAYPPGAIALFAILARLGGGIKIVMTAVSLGLLLLVASALKGSAKRLAVAALFPLPVLEMGIGAHIDGIAAMGIVAALIALRAEKDFAAGAWIGLGALFKPYVLAVVPFLARHPDRRAGQLVLGVLATWGGGYLLAWLFGWSGTGSLWHLIRYWNFGSPAVALLESLLPAEHGRTIVLLLAVAVCAFVWWRWDPHTRPERSLAMGLTLVLFFSPVMFPWYLISLAALLPFFATPVLVAWCLAVPFTYEVIDRFEKEGIWEPALWPLWLIALSLLLPWIGQRLKRFAGSVRMLE